MKLLKVTTVTAALFFSTLATASPVNINTASADQISTSLSGIGTSKARAIVHFRDRNGPFKKSEDVIQVKGIGNSIYDKNKMDILVK